MSGTSIEITWRLPAISSTIASASSWLSPFGLPGVHVELLQYLHARPPVLATDPLTRDPRLGSVARGLREGIHQHVGVEAVRNRHAQTRDLRRSLRSWACS